MKKLVWIHLYADDGQNLCLRVPLYLVSVIRYCCNLSDVKFNIL